jgi:hypothetical protein
MAEPEPIPLRRVDTPAWRVWANLAELSRHLKSEQWALVGGQMVALHLHAAGSIPVRTTTDIDVVADLLTDRSSLAACCHAAEQLDMTARPSVDGKTLHRFEGEAGVLDIMVADHLPSRMSPRLLRRQVVAVPGGQRALDRRTILSISTEAGDADIPTPDLRGAIVLKARAATADTRDRARHHLDLAQLAAIVEDPVGFAAELDSKERRALRKPQLGEDVTSDPWLQVEPASRQLAVDAWLTITDS